jgi:hypothetical protein
MPLFKKAVVGYRDEAPAPTRRGPLRGFVGAPNPDIQAEGFGLLETSPFDGFRNALREILGGRFVLEGEPRPPTGRRAHLLHTPVNLLHAPIQIDHEQKRLLLGFQPREIVVAEIALLLAEAE